MENINKLEPSDSRIYRKGILISKVILKDGQDNYLTIATV